jgi:hypothetical protein
MENSHRRIVAELREEHEQQIEQMRQEKEEALAEETQATLAGKSHTTIQITANM